MPRVIALVGSARRGHTHEAARRFLDHLRELGDIEPEIVALSDYRLESCRGRKLCFERGEEACPLHDDRDKLIEKLLTSDGVVFASPSYMFQVSGVMKTLFDRLAFFGHRPRFFGKASTNIVVRGLPFGGGIGKYLSLVASCFGFRTVSGSCITAREPMTDRDVRKMDETLSRHSRRFHTRLFGPSHPSPTLTMLMGFRIGRTTMRLELDDTSCDYRYYEEKGWFDSDYFYPVRLGPLKRAAGCLFDAIGRQTARRPTTQ